MSVKVFSVRNPVSDRREDHEHREPGGHGAAVGPLYDHCHTRAAGPRPSHFARHLLHVHPQKPRRFLPGNAASLGHGVRHGLQVTFHRQAPVAYPGILFWGGGSTNSVEYRGQRERGSGGR